MAKTPAQTQNSQKLVNWDDFKVFLEIKLDKFPGRPVVPDIQPLVDSLQDRIAQGEISAFSRSGKAPHVAGADIPLTDGRGEAGAELFAQGTYLHFGDIQETFDNLDPDAKGIIAEKLITRFETENTERQGRDSAATLEDFSKAMQEAAGRCESCGDLDLRAFNALAIRNQAGLKAEFNAANPKGTPSTQPYIDQHGHTRPRI